MWCPGPRFQDAGLGRVQRAPAGSSPGRCPSQGCWLGLTVHGPVGCTQYAVFKQKHAERVHMLISWQNAKPEAPGHPDLCFLGPTVQFLTSQCLWTLQNTASTIRGLTGSCLPRDTGWAWGLPEAPCLEPSCSRFFFWGQLNRWAFEQAPRYCRSSWAMVAFVCDGKISLCFAWPCWLMPWC